MPLEISGSRTTSSAISFFHSFRLGRDHRELPHGTYMIHTQEDVYLGAAKTTYLATSVDVIIEDLGRTTTRVVLPRDLADALTRDRQHSFRPALPDENPDRGRSTQATKTML